MHIQNPCGFFSNPQGFYVFAFCNTNQTISPSSVKATTLRINRQSFIETISVVGLYQSSSIKFSLNVQRA